MTPILTHPIPLLSLSFVSRFVRLYGPLRRFPGRNTPFTGLATRLMSDHTIQHTDQNESPATDNHEYLICYPVVCHCRISTGAEGPMLPPRAPMLPWHRRFRQ
jgi:hypothetical protein